MRKLLFFLALVILLTLAGVGYLAAQDQYMVVVDGDIVTVSGSYETVQEVLAAAGVVARPEDIVRPLPSSAADPSVAIEVQTARPVALRTESGTRTLWTHQPTLGAFLQQAGVVVNRTDQVFADGGRIAFNALDETPLPAEVEVGRFLAITIHDAGRQTQLRTAAQTVGAALQEAGITIYAADGVEPSLGTWLTPGLEIVVQRSMPIIIRVDGRVLQTRSHHTGVMDVLAEAGIGLVGFDTTRPGPNTALKPGDTIEVVRVTEAFQTADEPIPYETLWQATDQLDLDQRALLSAGVPGILRRRLRVRYENGAEVSRTPDGEWVAQEPVNEVLGYGTRINIGVVQGVEGAYEYWRMVRMRVTSYTAASAGRPPDHPAYGVTASGLQAGTGIVAIDPDVVPFRSWVYVPGYGLGFAGDTGGGVKGRWIDLGYHEDDYVSWHGYVDVYYLTPVPALEDIDYLIPTWLP